MSATALLNPDRFDSADTLVVKEPFPFLVASRILSEDKRDVLHKDFPNYREAGYLPYEEDECGPAIVQLIEEMTSPAVADKLGNKLGIEKLSQYPTIITISRSLNRRHGNIHTDGKAKVATALIYMNDAWDSTSGGCLRFLRGPNDIEDTLAPEVKPLYGNFAIFKRTDNSYHGHLPIEGERHVVQIAWVTSEEEKLRKVKRGSLSRFLKGIFGGADKSIGAKRDRSAAHQD